MPKYTVERSITINAPRDQVYPLLRDFRQWPKWSPWLITDPECMLEFADDGRGYAWDGPVAGSGTIEVADEQADERIDHTLCFLKPFKSQCASGFRLADADGGTQVTWRMDGALPFFMFWMIKMMVGWISGDFDRGLLMLKELVETGTAPGKLEFQGRKEFGGCRYVGIRNTCGVKDVGSSMQTDFGRLCEWARQASDGEPGQCLSIYEDWDCARGTCTYVVGMMFTNNPGELPVDFVSGAIPATPAYVVAHTGPYRFLGNAWSAGMAHNQAKKFRMNKKIKPFEIYANDPEAVPENELLTLVYLPMKG